MAILAFNFKFLVVPNPNGVGSELAKFFLLESLFCYSWFRLQLIAIHCNRLARNYPGIIA